MSAANSLKQAIYRRSDVCAIANVSESTLLRWENEGYFPSRIKLGLRASGYLAREVDAWALDPVKWREDNQKSIAS